MAYTVRQLITRAFYTSGKVSRGLETVEGEDLTDGLIWLNEILSMQAVSPRMIPFFKRDQFNAVVGQDTYFIAHLLEIEAMTFNIGPVRYHLRKSQRKRFFGSPRVDNVTTLPIEWHLEREKGGATISLYPLPADTYIMKLIGKFGLTDLTRADFNLDLLLTYELNYITYLRFLLAKTICIENNFSFQGEPLAELHRLEKQLKDVSPIDLTPEKLSQFSRRGTFNWGYANLYNGFWP